MTDVAPRPEYSATLRQHRAWAKANGGSVEHAKRGVIVITAHGLRHVYFLNKWRRDGLYS